MTERTSKDAASAAARVLRDPSASEDAKSAAGSALTQRETISYEGEGLSLLRDAFAIAALQGLCANSGGPFQQNDRCGWGIVNCTFSQIAEEAYGLADAMLKTRGNS